MPDNQQARVNKIMAAIGLSSGDRPTFAESHAFSDITGTNLFDFDKGLEEWEKANSIKLMIGRVFAKKMLNPENLNKYRNRVSQLKSDLQNRFIQNPEEANSPYYQNLLNSYGNMEQKLSNPETLNYLQNLFNQIKRPSDIDRIPVESVRSRLIY